jgi:dipeptidase
MVSKGASVDGSTMIGYNADSHVLFGTLYHYPRSSHPPGAKRKIFEWDTGKYLGEIPEVSLTYNVIGNMNEWGLAIGETTFGGLEALQAQPGAILDYGSLIYIALQRSKTAAEAIDTITSLMAQFGYASEGESFSIADPQEVWHFEMIGKGPGEVGAVWCAVRVPEGFVGGHANQARIQYIFALEKAGYKVRYSPDVMTFAIRKGFYNGTADSFSFSDVYNPVTWLFARGCEARVWAGFREVADPRFSDEYLDYVSGKNLSHRMPLFVQAIQHKVSVNLTIGWLGNHYEGTALDFQSDIGAGPFHLPYRWRPWTWSVKTHPSSTYFNERSAGTQQTGFSFVSQLRSWFQANATVRALVGVHWFAADDASCAPFVPFFCNISTIPHEYDNATGAIMEFDPDAAFWIINLVSNYAYDRGWDTVYPDIAATRYLLHQNFEKEIALLEHRLTQPHTTPEEAINATTALSNALGSGTVLTWKSLFAALFTKYMDGNVKILPPGANLPKVFWPGYGEAWYERIVTETGTRYLMPETKHEPRFPRMKLKGI